MNKTKRTAKPDTSNKPWVSNYPPLKEWLDKHEARCMQQIPVGGEHPCPHCDAGEEQDPQAYIETYIFKGGRLAVVVVRGNRMGWDIYTDGGHPEIAATLADAELRLGLHNPAGFARGTSDTDGQS